MIVLKNQTERLLTYRSLAVRVPDRGSRTQTYSHLGQKGLELDETLAQGLCAWVKCPWKAARGKAPATFILTFLLLSDPCLKRIDSEDMQVVQFLWLHFGSIFIIISVLQVAA